MKEIKQLGYPLSIANKDLEKHLNNFAKLHEARTKANQRIFEARKEFITTCWESGSHLLIIATRHTRNQLIDALDFLPKYRRRKNKHTGAVIEFSSELFALGFSGDIVLYCDIKPKLIWFPGQVVEL